MKGKYKNHAIIAVSAVFIVTVSAIVFSLMNTAATEKTPENQVLGESADTGSNVALGGAEDYTSAGNVELDNSWPGEIISSEISHVQPQREGVITGWRVRIGQAVSTGEVLGKISAPPATPELISMLAERTEAVARAKAEAAVADEFAAKEQLRFNALKDSIESNIPTNDGLAFTALDGMRKNIELKKTAVRSYIENTVSDHVLMLTNASDWRYYRYGGLNKQYGLLNPEVQANYEMALLILTDVLKKSSDPPIEKAEIYFTLAVRLANSSGDNEMVNGFKMTASDDQKDFFEVLSMYREAQVELSAMETEYKIMLSENSAMVEKDRSMAHAEVKAMEVSFDTVSNEIMGGQSIIAPRAGIVSAIYKKAGDLVDPGMPIAVISGYGNGSIIVRMRIPNNILKPKVGEILSVVRPGFPMDIRKVKMIGIGAALDDTGSFMADAALLNSIDWPVSASVRVIAPKNSSAPVIKLSSVWWNEEGAPQVWAVSEAGRIFSKKISVGRTFGSFIEIYDGLANGDRYIISPTPNIREDMLLADILPKEKNEVHPAESGGHIMPDGTEM